VTLANGGSLVANTSRTIIEEARRLYAPIKVVLVTACAESLRRRLKSRGCEADEPIDRRLKRAESF